MKTTTKKEQALNKLTNIQIKEFIMFKFRSGKNPSADEVDNTSRNYITVMSTLEDFLRDSKGMTNEELRDYSFFNMTFDDMDKYSYYLRAVKNNSASTHNQRLTVVGIFLSYLIDRYEDELTDVEEVRIRRVKRKLNKLEQTEPTVEKPFFTNEQMAQLHKYILTSPGVRNRKRLLAMFLLYRDTADRKDEVRNFVLSDIHFSDIEGYSYAVTPCTNKTLTEKKHFLKEDTVTALKEYLDERNPKNPNEQSIFLSNKRTKISTSAVYRMFKSLYINAGFGYIDEEGNKKTKYVVHSLRHSSITETCRIQGIHAAKVKAGHSSVNMTQNYSHTTDADRMKTTSLAFEYTL